MGQLYGNTVRYYTEAKDGFSRNLRLGIYCCEISIIKDSEKYGFRPEDLSDITITIKIGKITDGEWVIGWSAYGQVPMDGGKAAPVVSGALDNAKGGTIWIGADPDGRAISK